MALPKASLGNGSRLLLVFITCVCVYCGPTEQSLRNNESGTLKRTNLNQKSGWFQHERFRGELSDAVTKCSDSQCFGDKTTFENLGCYCDEACYKIFSDCCPDYEKQCGQQQLLEDKTSVWKCLEFEVERRGCLMAGPIGVWMISKCPADRPFEELRTKCENNPLSFFGYPVEDFIPVVREKDETYRNKHCAVCNGVENYTSWEVEVFTYVIPPDQLDLDSKLKFIEDNGGWIKSVLPGRGQPWRFCFGKNFKDKCSSMNHSLYRACVEGPVEVVDGEGSYFKNSACAECNGWDNIDSYDLDTRCNGSQHPGPDPEGFSIVFNLRKASERSTITPACPRDTVYDTTLKFCREGYIISSSGKLTSEFFILLWFKLSRGWIAIHSTIENNFKLALIYRFSLQDDQISKITFHMQNRKPPPHDFVVATFRLTLTPFQSLLMANQHKSIFNVTNKNTAFLELLNFTENFALLWKEITFIVVKMTSKQLSCYDEKKLQSHEYKVDKENGSLIVNKTGKIFSLEDHTLIKEEDGNITLCRKLLLSDCNEGAFVPLSPDEYVVFPNLTVYHNATERVFKFGEYLMSENKGTRKTSNITQTSILSHHSTISVCLPFKDTFPKTEVKYSANTASYALRTLALIGFNVSIVCLMLLLITYGLFQDLWAISGISLMNLSLSLLLSHLIWLTDTSHFTETKTCTVFAIFEHYFFQVSFLSMSAISYHSSYIFLQPFAGRFSYKPCRRLIMYSAFVWLASAIFVAICVTLDKSETFLVDYGTSCWLGNVNAKLYLFLLPLAILLSFNIVTSIRTALGLYRHDKERSRTLERQERKQNLLIRTKLATLVGFPWLIAFVGVLFPNVEAFEYMFVIFVCLQGLYIGMAFLFNKKTLMLGSLEYQLERKCISSYNPEATFEMT
ncbi:Cadherin EGF LAG seven-pass G-type receptor 1 [Paramuricea clavata]|uniref:Cadherin EGF LAG seven-pass G-type receptor 1 n=1 Tax=Paramuricea clavata TaxID=317549 RepID=A0A6S7IP78_PARCT|nr:Cadherin EGF LAG seven-pass G-type receptor 1 [Paramuricea clavata]